MKVQYLSDSLRLLCDRKDVKSGSEYVAVMAKKDSEKFGGLQNITYKTIIEMALFHTDNNCRLYSIEEFVDFLKSGERLTKYDFCHIQIPEYDRMKSSEKLSWEKHDDMYHVKGTDVIHIIDHIDTCSTSLHIIAWKENKKVLELHSKSYDYNDKVVVPQKGEFWGVEMQKLIYIAYRHFYANAERIVNTFSNENGACFEDIEISDFMRL